jgi:hypothetical protein
MITSFISKRTLSLLLIGLVLAGVVTFFVLRARNTTWVSGNYIAPHELQKLEADAAAGDPVAQYGLTLYIENDQKRIDDLIERSAKSGYPPAIITYTDEIMHQDKQSGVRACRILMDTAKEGYFPAVVVLSECIENGECGRKSNKKALKWAIFARLLLEEKNINKKILYLYDVDKLSLESAKDRAASVERRTRDVLNSNDINQAETAAKTLVTKVPKKCRWCVQNDERMKESSK